MFSEYNKNDLSVLTFNVTWECHVRCDYCYRANHISHDDDLILSEENLIKESNNAKQYDIKEYRFSGGEPISIGDKLFHYADIVTDITKQKPILLTSGYGITEKWLKKARNKFRNIAVSVENPFNPLQKQVNNKRILDIMKSNISSELPFSYGLTLLTAADFKNINKIFDYLYEYLNGKTMPQLEYLSIRDFVQPSKNQISDLTQSTKKLFEKYGIIPFYFVLFIGSLNWLPDNIKRIVLNLHPEGNYQIYKSLTERWQVEYRWQNYVMEQHDNSSICLNCEWIDACKYHPQWELKYDWCEIRKAIFQGAFEGLKL